MTRLRRLALALPLCAALAGCGTEGIELDPGETASIRRGAELFDQRCAACHTFSAAGSEGSAFNVNQREYKDGPNFDVRAEEYDQVLYAIRNGGFSSGPMPQNIVVGKDAEDVARFVEKYAGRDAPRDEPPREEPPVGVQGGGTGASEYDPGTPGGTQTTP